MTILYCILSFLFGCGILYLCLRGKIQATQVQDAQTLKENHQIQEENNYLTEKSKHLNLCINDLNKTIDRLNHNVDSLNKDINNLVEKKQILDSNYEEANRNAEQYYQKANELASEKFSQSAEVMAQSYQKAENDYQQEYLNLIKEASEQYADLISQKQQELDSISQALLDAKKKQDAVVEANRRAEEVRQKEQFYKLNLSDTDKEEIKHLRSVIPYLRSAEPINKVIWKVYYEKPYSDLVGRVVGQGVHTGIYKITNLENGMCYVGQATNISERWRQHIKRGVGAEAPTRNKLYPAMYEIGPENFTFEVLEECDRSLLDSREDYFQEFYQAREYGYSIK